LEVKTGLETGKILIVEDEPLFGEMLRLTLSGEPEFEVVGVIQDGREAVNFASRVKPDAVLMDIELKGEMDGIEASLRIKRERPETGIVILSAHNNRRYLSSLPLYESPGWSYLLKQSVPNLATVIRAIQGSRSGMLVLDPMVVAGLQPKPGSRVADLAPRQLEVLELMAQGYNNAAIADHLTLAGKSVETYINAIYRVMRLQDDQDIHSRVTATLLYLEESQSRA